MISQEVLRICEEQNSMNLDTGLVLNPIWSTHGPTGFSIMPLLTYDFVIRTTNLQLYCDVMEILQGWYSFCLKGGGWTEACCINNATCHVHVKL